MDRIKVLIVDDLALYRETLRHMMEQDPAIEVVGDAIDAVDARQKIKALDPDVVTLDIEMPGMNGLEFLKKIMTLRPMPVVMVSTLTRQGADATLKALEIGAVDYVAKPQKGDLETCAQELIAKVKLAARVSVRPYEEKKYEKALPDIDARAGGIKLIAFGASTGGISALNEIIRVLPLNSPPVVIAQHIPAEFSARFAARANSQSRLCVVEAADGDRLRSGHVYIAPGGVHMTVALNRGGDMFSMVGRVKREGFYKPSVNVLFSSVAQEIGPRAIGVILTGMGKDGARGLLEMHNAGAVTLGQNRHSCVVYGMPRAAFLAGAVQQELSLNKIAPEIASVCGVEKDERMKTVPENKGNGNISALN